MEKIVLVGFGGHGESVADSIERQGLFEVIGYTDNEKKKSKYSYLGTDDILDDIYNDGVKNAAVCVGYIGEGDIRRTIYGVLKRIGYSLPIIIDPSAVISENSIIEEGVFVGKNAVINSCATIKKMSIINTAAVIEHDVYVDEFSHISVNSTICGGASIGANCMIGAGAVVIHGVNVSNECIVSAGSTVIRNIESGTIYYGIGKDSRRR